MRPIALLIIFLILVSTEPATSQSDEEAPIKVSTILANVPVIVSDRTGKHVAGIKPEDFKITSAGNPKEIVYFSDSEMPLSVAIVLDITGSVHAVLDGIKKAANEYVNQLGPERQVHGGHVRK
jgi:hypothetical protein